MRHIILISFLTSMISLPDLCGQSIATEFGKNRVQHHDDHLNWSRYETENFITYWYGKARNIAQPVIQLAELDHEEIQKILEHTLSDKIEILVYVDLTDMKQTNIGLDQAFTNKEKATKVEGNKILVYFDGNHQNLRTQIRKGIANVYINSVLYGSNLQEIVQNALLLNLPIWFSEGLVAYSGSTWDRYIEDELRDLYTDKNMWNFDKLMKEHPRVAGHSLWNYVAKTFGGSAIANIVYLTRISRNLENSFLFILGVDFDTIKENWANHYRQKFYDEENRFTTTDKAGFQKLKNKKGIPISTFRVSPDGKLMAYVVNDRSKERIYLRDLTTGEDRLIFKNGYKNIFQEPDYNYPLIAWHPSYPELTIIYEHDDKARLRKIDLKQKTEETEDLTTNFQRVYSMSYIRSDEYLLSASTDGYSDLYIYKSDNRHHTRITEDFYDDLDAEVVTIDGRQNILFRSNRTSDVLEKNKIDTILPIENFDLFLLRGFEMDSELVRLTRTPHTNERAPYMSGATAITYLHGRSGMENLYEMDLSTGAIKPLTNAERNIIRHHTVPATDHHFYNYYYDGNYVTLDLGEVEEESAVPHKTDLAAERSREQQDHGIPFLPPEEAEPDDIKMTEGMKFQSPYDDVEDLQPLDDDQNDEISDSMFEKYFKDYFSDSYHDGKRVVHFKPMRASASRERFRLDNFITRMDNSVLFEGLESYTGEDKELNGVPTAILFKGVVKDLLEDYAINVGLRVPIRFNGYEFFVTVDDNKRTWDKKLALYRKSVSNIIDEQANLFQWQKRHTFLGLYRLKYPFNVYTSLRFTTSLRFDKYFLQSTEPISFQTDFEYEKRLSFKTEFVFDNSYDVNINIKNGTRMKFYAEAINEFDFELDDGINVDASKAVTGVIGMDARHYIPIFKRAVLALRAAAATSTGSKRVVYYIGGMEGWIGGGSETGIPVPGGDQSAFKVLAPQLRGFKNNIRNGNTYLLSNAEFRLPVSHFIGLGKSSFGFLRNLQLTSFFDAGTAWYGANPDTEENTLNTAMVSNLEENPTITVNARFFRSPLVYGYGFGIRSTVLSYFLKFDYGWGVETGIRQKPRFYFSLGMDF